MATATGRSGHPREEQGDLDGALIVEAVTAPPGPLAIGLAGLAAAIVGAVLDVVVEERTLREYTG